MTQMKIRCPTCKNVVIAQGNPREKIFITCPKCNTQGVFTFPFDTSLHSAQKEGNTIRPIGVTILAILAIISALSIIFNFGFYASISPVIDSLTSLNFFLILLLLLGIVLIVIFFMIAYGFWKGSRWSWYVAIIFLIIGIIIQIIAVPLTLFLFSGASLSTIINTFYFFTILRTVIFVLLYNLIFGLIIFYLTRPHVRTYFHIDHLGDIKSIIKANRKIVYILVIVFIVAAIILMWGFQSTGAITLISVTQTPEHPQAFDDITITAEISGGSPFGGAGVSFSYTTYFGEGSKGSSEPMRYIGDNKYTAILHDSNGTEIWYFIRSGNNVLGEHTIQIGHIERSNKTSLAITNMTQVPEKPTSETTSITLTVNVTSNVTVIDVLFIKEIISPSGYHSSGGSGMRKIHNNTYSETIYQYGFGNQYHNFESGTKIYYRIAAIDKSGNTAVITKNIII